MRLRPVAPVMIRRALRPIDVGGRVIPAGVDVFVAPVASHRLPALFEAAADYNPDRYLADPKQTTHLHGFDGGMHRCLGEHLVRLLTHVAAARLLQRYYLTLIDPDPAPVRTPAFKGPALPAGSATSDAPRHPGPLPRVRLGPRPEAVRRPGERLQIWALRRQEYAKLC